MKPDPFYEELRAFALLTEEQLSDGGDGGQPGCWLDFDEVSGNYPWVYVDYRVRGLVDMLVLESLKSRFEDFLRQKGAQYLTLTFRPLTASSFHARVRLIYRPDLQKPKPGVQPFHHDDL